MQIFEEVLFFQAMYNTKTEKQTNNSLCLCQFDADKLWKACLDLFSERRQSTLFQIIYFFTAKQTFQISSSALGHQVVLNNNNNNNNVHL